MEVGGAWRGERLSQQGWTKCHMDGQRQMEESAGGSTGWAGALVRGTTGSREDPPNTYKNGELQVKLWVFR